MGSKGSMLVTGMGGRSLGQQHGRCAGKLRPGSPGRGRPGIGGNAVARPCAACTLRAALGPATVWKGPTTRVN